MQPRPIADTVGPFLPKCRVSMICPLLLHQRYAGVGFDERPFKPDTWSSKLPGIGAKNIFAWLSPSRLRAYRIHFSRVSKTNPLLITGYPLDASKEMLT